MEGSIRANKHAKMQGRVLLVSLLPLLFLSAQTSTLLHAPGTFCSRAITTKSCPAPPTVDSIDIQSYLGTWYEIGSTASFKLVTESGLVCVKAQYSEISGNFSLINSGLTVVSSSAGADVAAVSSAATNVCSNVKDVCTYLSPTSTISQALQQISQCVSVLRGSHPEIAAALSNIYDEVWDSVKVSQMTLEVVAMDISQIQYYDGQLSQANGSFEGSVEALKHYPKKLRKEQASIIALVEHLSKAHDSLNKISSEARIKASIVHQLNHASASLGEAAKQISARNSVMRKSISDIKTRTKSLLSDGKPIKGGGSFGLRGQILQNTTAHGKLEVIIEGTIGPYWIVALEGERSAGYDAALIYSCTDVQYNEGIFILSRKRELSLEVVRRFLSLAESYGIYSDCDNAFLFTVQRDGDCGKPTNA